MSVCKLTTFSICASKFLSVQSCSLPQKLLQSSRKWSVERARTTQREGLTNRTPLSHLQHKTKINPTLGMLPRCFEALRFRETQKSSVDGGLSCADLDGWKIPLSSRLVALAKLHSITHRVESPFRENIPDPRFQSEFSPIDSRRWKGYNAVGPQPEHAPRLLVVGKSHVFRCYSRSPPRYK